MRSYPATLGVVLAGGRARRMGGQDKAMIKFLGKPMIAYSLDNLHKQCESVVINANGNTDRFEAFSLPVIPDFYPDYRGPLAGILSTLDWMAENRPHLHWLASSAVDTPWLPDDFVHKLHTERQKISARLAMARSGTRTHPLNALWPVSLRTDIRHSLETELSRRVEDWMMRYPIAFADWQTNPVDPFLNINSHEELERAEAQARLEHSPAKME